MLLISKGNNYYEQYFFHNEEIRTTIHINLARLQKRRKKKEFLLFKTRAYILKIAGTLIPLKFRVNLFPTAKISDITLQ